MPGCKHMGEILDAEMDIVKRHVQDHKWFQHLTDDDDAAIDFIEKFGFVMREMYCGHVCKDRFKCTLANKFLNKQEEEKTTEATKELLKAVYRAAFERGFNAGIDHSVCREWGGASQEPENGDASWDVEVEGFLTDDEFTDPEAWEGI